MKRVVQVRSHPARLVVVGFATAIAIGTGLLMLPFAAESGDSTDLVTALFTSTSAVCVTGLVVVDTGGHWSGFGEGVILALIQIGGLGIMTLASLLALLVSRRLGLRLELTAQTETKTLGLGDVRRVVGRVILLSLLLEAVTAVLLTIRFLVGYDEPLGRAAYLGVFHAVSAFNNAGFSPFADSLVGFATDPYICVPIMVAIVLGGIGFPVIFEVGRYLRRHRLDPAVRRLRWSMHAKITVIGYFGLLVLGTVAITAFEWNASLAGHSGADRLLVGIFHGVMPRTAGFNSVDVAEMQPVTLLVHDILMFIGGGSAGTAGGIKVTTFALLAFVILAEIRGEPTVHVLGRRLPAEVQRQALTVALMGVAAVMLGTLTLLALTPLPLDAVLFEATSAFGTVGLSVGITDDLPTAGRLVLVGLMFVGRLGSITLASALALRERPRRYELPEERPIVG